MTDPRLNFATGEVKTDPPTDADPLRLLDVLERIAAALNCIAADTTSMAGDLAALNGRDSVWRAS